MSLSAPKKHRIRNVAISVLGVLVITSGCSAGVYYLNQKALSERLADFERAQDAKSLAYQAAQTQQWNEQRESEQAVQSQTQAIHNEITALKQSLTAQSEQLSQKAAGEDVQWLREQSSDIEKRILALSGKIVQLSQRKPRVAPTQTTPPSTTSKHRTHKVQVKAKPKKPPQAPAPFVLFDIQKRGMHQVAVLGALNATSMKDLSSVREGQRYQRWTIKRIESQGVWISKRNTTLFLEKSS